jgi:hypothetical protein
MRSVSCEKKKDGKRQCFDPYRNMEVTFIIQEEAQINKTKHQQTPKPNPFLSTL